VPRNWGKSWRDNEHKNVVQFFFDRIDRINGIIFYFCLVDLSV
jgi:hypothetical protein